MADQGSQSSRAALDDASSGSPVLTLEDCIYPESYAADPDDIFIDVNDPPPASHGTTGSKPNAGAPPLPTLALALDLPATSSHQDHQQEAQDIFRVSSDTQLLPHALPVSCAPTAFVPPIHQEHRVSQPEAPNLFQMTQQTAQLVPSQPVQPLNKLSAVSAWSQKSPQAPLAGPSYESTDALNPAFNVFGPSRTYTQPALATSTLQQPLGNIFPLVHGSHTLNDSLQIPPIDPSPRPLEGFISILPLQLSPQLALTASQLQIQGTFWPPQASTSAQPMAAVPGDQPMISTDARARFSSVIDPRTLPPPSPMKSDPTLQLIQHHMSTYTATSDKRAMGQKAVILYAPFVACRKYPGAPRDRIIQPPVSAIVLGAGLEAGECQGQIALASSKESMLCPLDFQYFTSDGSVYSDRSAALASGKEICSARGYARDVVLPTDEADRLVKLTADFSIPDPRMKTESEIGVAASVPIRSVAKPVHDNPIPPFITHGSIISLFTYPIRQGENADYMTVSNNRGAVPFRDWEALTGGPAPWDTESKRQISADSWDAFVIYICDPTVSPGVANVPSRRGLPSPPRQAFPLLDQEEQPPVHYNQTVILQCVSTGDMSPILIVREVNGTSVFGTKRVTAPPKRTAQNIDDLGSPISQLHQVAFEDWLSNADANPRGNKDDHSRYLCCSRQTGEVQMLFFGRRTVSLSPLASPSTPSYASLYDAPDNGGTRASQSWDRTGYAQLSPPLHIRDVALDGKPVFPYMSWQTPIGLNAVWHVVNIHVSRFYFCPPPNAERFQLDGLLSFDRMWVKGNKDSKGLGFTTGDCIEIVGKGFEDDMEVWFGDQRAASTSVEDLDAEDMEVEDKDGYQLLRAWVPDPNFADGSSILVRLSNGTLLEAPFRYSGA